MWRILANARHNGKWCRSAGQTWRLPRGMPHKVASGDQPMRAVDVFYPVREDMRA